MEGRGDEELWLLKRPIKIRQSGTSPFFEGEAELQMCQTLRLFAQQTFTGRRTAAWNEPTASQPTRRGRGMMTLEREVWAVIIDRH